jgi:hypothetical protein
MGYRDEDDTLYQRSLILQRELDHARAELAERDRELAAFHGAPPARDATRLKSYQRRAAVLEAARDRLDKLDDETLVVIGAIIEELAMEPARRDGVLEELRPICGRIATEYQVKTRRQSG